MCRSCSDLKLFRLWTMWSWRQTSCAFGARSLIQVSWSACSAVYLRNGEEKWQFDLENLWTSAGTHGTSEESEGSKYVLSMLYSQKNCTHPWASPLIKGEQDITWSLKMSGVSGNLVQASIAIIRWMRWRNMLHHDPALIDLIHQCAIATWWFPA